MAGARVQSDSLVKQLQQEQLAFCERIRALRQKLSEASSQEDKKAARQQLRKSLAEIFDQDMQMRKKAAAKIESRLAKLRQQYEARQTARDEIIDLQLKVIEQDEAGLEFPSALPSGFNPFPSATPADPPSVRRKFPTGATRVDEFDPILKERTLDEVKTKVDPELPTTITSEFNALRDQYRKAKTPLALAEAHFNSLVAEAQKQNPTTSIDEVKKQHPVAWRAVERMRPDFETAHRLLETKLELLVLDLKKATLAVDAAKANLQQVSELHKRNAALLSEVNQKRTVLEAAELDVERANRLIKLFESIRSEPTFSSDATPPDGLPEGLASSVTEQIQSLGLKLGHEMKTSLDTRYPMRIAGKDGEVTIKAGETKLIELPKPTLSVQWQCGDFNPEAIDDVEPFDYVLVEWKSDGHVTWSCYRSSSASAPTDDKPN
jgi:hypothetical protein